MDPSGEKPAGSLLTMKPDEISSDTMPGRGKREINLIGQIGFIMINYL